MPCFDSLRRGIVTIVCEPKTAENRERDPSPEIIAVSFPALLSVGLIQPEMFRPFVPVPGKLYKIFHKFLSS